MTAPKTQIQALIRKIDEVLQSKPPLNPSQKMNDAQQQQVLEQARQYLSSLQNDEQTRLAENSHAESGGMGGASPALPTFGASSSALATQYGAGIVTTPGGSGVAPAESAQQVLQAVVQEMNYLRVNMMQPLREELMTLYQQRQLVTADIQRLEQQRQDLLLANQQLNQQQLVQNFMQSLTDKLQEQLAAQIAQTYSNLELQAAHVPAGALEGAADQTQLSPGQRLLYMQKLQEQSDDMLLRLDATLRVVFDSLQTNVEGYHESLIHGLEKLRGLGQQGEALMAALLNRFAEQVGRGAASHYLQASPRKEWELPGLGSVEGPDSGGIPRHRVQSEDQVAVPDKLSEEQLDRFINTLDDVPESTKDGEGLDNLTLADSPIDDDLIDELLGTLNAEGEFDEITFNLDDVDLPTDDLSLSREESGDADTQPQSDVESSSSDPLTLFEIEEDGVRVHLEGDRLDQLREQETDSFLNDLDIFTQQTTARQTTASSAPFTSESSAVSDEGDADFQSSSAVDADDEALAFLDQMATQVEDELSFASMETDTTESNTSIENEGGISGESVPSGTASDVPNDALSDDIIAQSFAFFQQDDRQDMAGVEQSMTADSDLGVGSDRDSDTDSDRGSSSDSDSETDPFVDLFNTADQGSATVNESPGGSTFDLLGNLFAEPEENDDEPMLGSLMGSLSSDSVEASIDDDDDLFADLGLADSGRIVQSSEPNTLENQADTSAENIETISSLTQLIDDTEARASVESASDLSRFGDGQMGEVDNPFQLDESAADRYVVASSKEDLLASDAPDQKINQTVPLDENQRQRLAIDLANVEGLDTSEILSSLADAFRGSDIGNAADDAAPSPEGDTLEGFFAGPSQESDSVEGFLSPDDDFFSVDDELPDSEADFSSGAPATDESVAEESSAEESESEKDLGLGTSSSEGLLADLDFLGSEETESPGDNPTLDDVAQAKPDARRFDTAAPELDIFSGSEDAAESLGGMMQDLFWESETDPNLPDFNLPETRLTDDAESKPEAESASTVEPASIPENVESVVTTPQEDETTETGNKDFTLSSLFSGEPESSMSPGAADAPEVDLFSRLEESEQLEEDDELKGIFEELQSLGDDFDQEANQAQQEQTLLDLIKGVNQPTIPDDDLPAIPPESGTDFTWTVFDNMDVPDNDATSEEKKNNGF